MFDLGLTVENLLSIPVLVFVLAFLATRLKSDIKLPDAIYQGITIFLLVGIGIKGGHALKASGGHDFVKPAAATLLLGVLVPLIAYWLISAAKKISKDDRASIAAHYGSTSLVTFSAGLVMLESLQVFVEPYVATLLAIMEIPGIIVGIYLGVRKTSDQSSRGRISETLREVFLGRTVVLLVGALLAGYFAPEQSFSKIEPFFVQMQPGILVLFLLQLGAMVGSRISSIKQAGWAIPIFAILMPVLAGTLGVAAGILIGMSVGGATMLAVLCASASYIAAPAAVGIALPKANLGLALTSSLGITFPFNLIIGIPLYLTLAQAFSGALS